MVISDYEVPDAIFDLESQVNILPKVMRQAIGAPRLVPTSNYLKLVDQKLVEPIRLLQGATVDLQGVQVKSNFEVLDLQGF